MSIRYKFLILLVIVSALAIVAYLILALKVFNKDKVEYVFETSVYQAQTIGRQIQTECELGSDILNSILAGVRETTFSESAVKSFEQISSLEYVALFQLETGYSDREKKYLRLGILEKKNGLFRALSKHDKIDTILDRVSFYDQYITFNKDSGRMLIGKIWTQNGKPVLALASFHQRKFANLFFEANSFKLYLIRKDGAILLESRDEGYENIIEFTNDELSNLFAEDKLPDGTYSLSTGKKKPKSLITYFRVKNNDLIVVSVVKESDVLGAEDIFMKKSILIFVMVLSFTIIFGLWFAKKLTSSLMELLRATRRIMDGHFDLLVRVDSRDEVASVANSFNMMSMELARLLSETAQKTRMEAELKTAQIIQDTLFPEIDYRYEFLNISGHYQPASEIGGDWWYHSKIGDKVFLWIGDATGHGAPAALLTSAAKSAATILEMLNLGPAHIMELLNKSIYDVSKGRMMMTFFVAIVDLKTKQFTYANASHQPPFLVKKEGSEFKKSMILPLNAFNNPRLGEMRDTRYDQGEFQLEPNDAIFFYTDGVEDLRNKANEALGDRGFVRAFVKNYKDFPPANTFINRLCTFFYEHSKGVPIRDDVTFFMCKYE